MTDIKTLAQQKAPTTPELAGTKTRILDAASRLFAEKGFSNVGIREISQAAGVHLAAVNYHFQSKENLWDEALRHSFAYTSALTENTYIALENAKKAGTVEAAELALKEFIERILHEFLQSDWDSGAMLLWELMGDGRGLDSIVEQYLLPPRVVLREVLRLLMPKAREVTLDLWAGSIVGQCVFARQGLPVTKILMKWNSREEYVRGLTRQVTEFCLSAVRQYRAQRGSA